MVPKGWSLGLFEDGIELISGQHVEAKYVNSVEDGKPYLTGPADFPKGKVIVTKYTNHAKKECVTGDLLITVKGSGTGKVIEADSDYAISRQLMAIRAKTFDSKFCYYNLVSSVKRYEDAAAGLIPGISREDVLNTPIMIPPLPEQQKIAKILSTWDKAITTTERLITTSKQQKKALMQQLLTGKKRLVNPETGKAFEGEWEKGSIGDYISFSGGSQPPRSTFIDHYKDGYIRLIQIRDYKTDNFITYIPIEKAKKLCNEDDIMIGRYGPPIFQILRGIKGAYNVALIKAIPNRKIEKEFMYFFLCLEALFEYIESFSRRTSGQTGIEMDRLKSYPIDLPNKEEQQKIVSVLTAADKEIEVLEAKLSHFKQEKKALMQQLLTGKRRVKVDEMEVA